MYILRAHNCVTDQSRQFTSYDLPQKCILTIFKPQLYNIKLKIINSPIYLVIFQKKCILNGYFRIPYVCNIKNY